VKKIKIIFANLIFLGFILAGLEYSASVILSKDNDSIKNNRTYEIKKKAYEGLDDEYKKLIAPCPKQKILTNNTDGSSVRYENSNWSCAGTSIKNNRRVTTYQPSEFKRTVYVFGGSTVFGTGSSDEFTIPSILQKKFNDNNYKTKVVNYGFSTLVASQQLQRLLKIPIKKDDIVIFYDGGNDIVQREIYNKPEGTIIGYNQNNIIGIFLSDFRNFLAQNSKFYNLLGKIKRNSRGEVDRKNISKCTVNDFNKIDFERKWQTYYDALIKAKHYTESKGGSFYHFLQPTLNFNLLKSSDFEYLKAIGETGSSSLCFLELVTNHYQNLNNSYSDWSAKFNGKSLSKIFLKNSSKNPGYYFLDFVHITPHGNALVVDAIFENIKK